MGLNGTWDQVHGNNGTQVRIGSLPCLPLVQDGTVTAWLVPFDGQLPRIVTGTTLGGAPVWLITDETKIDDMSTFEASYWGLGLAAVTADGTVCTLVEPTTIRPARTPECSTVAAYGWRLPDGH